MDEPREIRRRAAALRASLDNPNGRRVANPDHALAVRLLLQAHQDVVEMPLALERIAAKLTAAQKAIRALADALYQGRQAVADAERSLGWMKADRNRLISLDLVAAALQYDSEQIAQRLLRPLEPGLIDWLRGVEGAACPLCRARGKREKNPSRLRTPRN